MPRLRTLPVLLPVAAALIVSACTWVPIAPEAQKVRVLRAEPAGCEKAGEIDVEVIDARSFEPFDLPALLKSLEKTSRLVIVDEDIERAGFAAEVSAQVMEHGYDLLDAPVKRVCHPNMPIPGGYMDVYTMPTEGRIEDAIREVCQ